MKAGVFIEPQVRRIIGCSEFPKKLARKETKAWESFIVVVQGFFGNNKADNYVELVETLVKSYGQMGCKMNIKDMDLLDAHLDNFKENIEAHSDEKREQSHQHKIDF